MKNVSITPDNFIEESKEIIPKKEIISSPVIVQQEHVVLVKNNLNRKDIVIGMAQNIDPKNLAVFCFSLRK